MELIRGLQRSFHEQRGCAVTIGNFDGMHRGHLALLGQLTSLAAALAIDAVAVIFEPQPREYFEGARAPARLMKLREKLVLLKQAGVNRVLLLRFNETLANLEAEAFIHRVLVEKLGAKAVVIGDDFRFGRGRRGDFDMLKEQGGKSGFTVQAAETFYFEGERVSSSRVRTALMAGDMEMARCLLGRYYAMEGRVVEGDKRGRALGFPTLNLDPRRGRSALQGIFAAHVEGLGPRAMEGVAYIGHRPAVGGGRLVLETHVFDFEGDCYGRRVRVEFVRKLREDLHFPSLTALTAQMSQDAEQARRVLAEIN